MFTSILVPLDRSTLAECVLPHALAVAEAFGTDITLLHVLDPVMHSFVGHAVQPMDWQLERLEAERYLESVAQRLRTAETETPVEVKWALLEGSAAEAIVGFTTTFSHPLIVLSTHGQSGLTGWIVSSVTQKVASRAPASLLIVRAHLGVSEPQNLARYKRVLVPLDGSQRAECVAPVATQLAERHDAEIVLVHIVSSPETPRRMPMSPEEASLVEALTERNRVEGEQYVDDMRARLSATARAHVIVSRHVGTALQDVVVREGADMVIVSAHGYSGESIRPFGSVARNLLEYCATHLLIIQDSRAMPRVQPPAQAETAPRAPITVSGAASEGG